MTASLKKQDWERDVVYLVQFPRALCVPSLSPFCLKLETWLRMADIKYENVDGGFFSRSNKGQMPFVELNGQEMDDSTIIIDQLTEIFDKQGMESHLGKQEKAMAHAINALIEGSLFWTLLYDRSTRTSEILGDQVVGSGSVTASSFESQLKTKLFHQGMGRNSPEEVLALQKQDLTAISVYLDKKKFLTGDIATRLDATAFGHLAQFWYTRFHPKELLEFLNVECPNIGEFLECIKAEFWPDWDEACSQVSLTTDWKKAKQAK